MTAPDLYLVTFQEFARLGYDLAEKIKIATKSQPIDLIVCINRGGAMLSRILSDYLDVDIAAFGIASYDGINDQKELTIYQELNQDLEGKVVLLVDEICDSGRTFVKAVEVIEQLKPQKIITAALITKPKAAFTPDHYMLKTDKWVVFPYEVRETTKALKGVMQANSSVRDQLQQYYLELGIGPKEFTTIEQSVWDTAV